MSAPCGPPATGWSVHGCLDPLHYGHLHLSEAASLVDRLVVTVTADLRGKGPGRSLGTSARRYAPALRMVDSVAVSHAPIAVAVLV
jgi:cytidyltransferase-like protein